MSKKNFDIYDYVHNNKFTLKVEQKGSNTFKGYNDIRKTNINEVIVNENGLDLKASLQENRMLAPELKKHFLDQLLKDWMTILSKDLQSFQIGEPLRVMRIPDI